MTTTLDRLRTQLADLIETAAADTLEIQQQQQQHQDRLIQHATDQAFRAGEENGRMLERAHRQLATAEAFKAGEQHGRTLERAKVIAMLDYRLSGLSRDGLNARTLLAFRADLT